MIRDNRKCYEKFIQREKKFCFGRVKTEIKVEADAIICAGRKTLNDISREFLITVLRLLICLRVDLIAVLGNYVMRNCWLRPGAVLKTKLISSKLSHGKGTTGTTLKKDDFF